MHFSQKSALPAGTNRRGRPIARVVHSAAAVRFAGCVAWLACLGGVGGCGYTVGAPYSQEVRSVYVPIFKSESFRRGIEYQLTEAVQKQIQQRTPFLLVGTEEEADTKLTGRILNETKTVLGQTQYSDARQLQLNLMVEVTWEDLRTRKILKRQRVPVGPDTVQQNAQSEFAPEVGQSLATATQQVTDSMARNIVGMMEVPW